ncbi:MAG: hypothetical protein AB2728_05415 [Candidatus Thiodiazotropha sp.]|nr:hypothetical protein [Candidatus Thiodiazotropha sp. (ex Lucina pensylvanica)]MBT3064948.1 hypothetical protein [Candidatus Thiodiazotropha sp. (ex Lucina pensylvanica)]MBV2095917.1 hypothetical protein [Candidatus Thiodiazotropha sp. (ex Codakia orbicularis)]PUB77096.1 MAG: hypothetical protein DBP03_04000 [gamma proteobacterium symbiont of Ctena orbiculata]
MKMGNKELQINDHGAPLILNYGDALKFHQGNAYWGCALAFRMLQYAARLLSAERTWERQDLVIESGHPGPGVRDTIEYVTGCVSGGRFKLTCATTDARCVSDMDYSWRLSDGRHRLQLKLAPGIVSPEFLQLLDRIDSNEASKQQLERLETLKESMTEEIWSLDLEEAFPNPRLSRC